MPGTVKKLQFSEGTDVGAPTDLSLSTSTTTISEFVDDTAFVTSEGAATGGSCYINSTFKCFRIFTGTAWRNCFMETDPSDATKLLVKDLSGQTTGVTTTIACISTVNRTITFPDATGTIALFSGNDLPFPSAANAVIGGNLGANSLTLGQSTSTVVIPGNLTVQGTTTTIDTINTDVKDKNIMVNKGGNDTTAEGAGLTVDRTGTDGSMIYEDALASKWKAGALGSEIEMANVSSNQSLTNKRVLLHTTVAGDDTTSPRITKPTNTLANLQAITSGNHPAPSSEYWASDVKKAYVWNGSALVPSGSGSGSGRKNYITDPDSIGALWVATGAGVTVANTTTAADLPEESKGFAIKMTSVSGTDSIRARFTLDDGDKSRPFEVSFYLKTLAGYASGDFKVELFSNSASNYGGSYTQLSVVPGDVLVNAGGVFVQMNAVMSGADYFELRFTATNGTASIACSGITVTPSIITNTLIVTEPEAHTLVTAGMGTIVSPVVTKWRVGNMLKMKGYFYVGTLSGAQAPAIFLPTGLNVDLSLMPDTRSTIYGHFKQLLSSTTDLSGSTYDGVLTYASGSTDSLTLTTQSQSQLFAGLAANVVLSSSVQISFEVEVPIAEWKGSGTTTDEMPGEYREVKTSGLVSFPAANAFDDLGSIDLTPGIWDVVYSLNATVNASDLSFIQTAVTTTPGNFTTGIDSNLGNNANAYVNAGAGQQSVLIKYRLVVSTTATYYAKVSGGYSSGTPQYQGNLNATRVLTGQFSGASEIIETAISYPTYPNNADVNLLTFTLPAGVWDLDGMVTHVRSSGATRAVTFQQLSISDTISVHNTNPNYVFLYEGNVSNSSLESYTITVPSRRITLAVETILYLVFTIIFTSSNTDVRGYLNAKKVG